jgi:predicted dehydrogenase
MLRVSLIGLGMAVEPHARSLLELQDRVSVAWAASRSPERTASFARRYPFATTNDVAAAIADPDVDAVFILTPADTHAALATQALRLGKHVLIEKPLDASLGAAEQIVVSAADCDRRAGVVLQHRFRASALRLRALLDGGELGSIEGAHLHFSWWRPQSYYDSPGRGSIARDGGGVLLTQAIHAIDLLRSLVGPIHVIASAARTTALHRMETEDHVVAMLRLASGAIGSVVATTAAYPGFPEVIEIIGTHGTARLTGDELQVHFIDGSHEYVEGDGRSGAGQGVMDFSHAPHRALIEDFVCAIQQHRSPLASAQEALDSQRLIQAMLAAS